MEVKDVSHLPHLSFSLVPPLTWSGKACPPILPAGGVCWVGYTHVKVKNSPGGLWVTCLLPLHDSWSANIMWLGCLLMLWCDTEVGWSEGWVTALCTCFYGVYSFQELRNNFKVSNWSLTWVIHLGPHPFPSHHTCQEKDRWLKICIWGAVK